jgi:hypothetical protein
MTLNLGHNEGEANILATRASYGPVSGILTDCGVAPAVIASTPFRNPRGRPDF